MVRMCIENHLTATGKVIEPKPPAPPVRPKGGPRGREEKIYEKGIYEQFHKWVGMSKAKAA